MGEVQSASPGLKALWATVSAQAAFRVGNLPNDVLIRVAHELRDYDSH
jgi:hypothetical protein